MNKLVKLLFLVLYSAVFVFLFLKIFEAAKYSTITRDFLNDCEPNPYGIYEKELFHHVLERCNRFIEREYLTREEKEDELEYEFKVETNSLGFRNKEYDLNKDNSTFRIILLGDSFTYGFGVENRDTFYSHIEKNMNKACTKEIEVWNLGFTSWGTVIHYLITRDKMDHYNSDSIILMFDTSDFSDNLFYESQANFLNGDIKNISSSNQKWYDERKRKIDESFANSSNYSIVREEIHNITLKYIYKINNLAKERELPFEVIFYPYARSLNETALKYVFDSLNKNKIEYYSLFPYFNETNVEEYYDSGHLHWNKKGSKYVAEILTDHLISKEYIYHGAKCS